MSSKRIVFSCAVLVFGVIAGNWYAVDAFPMAQAPGLATPSAAQAAVGEPGPLERSAKAITPENPIPRRTYSVMPRNPGGADAGTVAVTLRATINALGRVGEARAAGHVAGGRGNSSVAPPSDVFVKAALDAVRQWVYEPPAEAPISFDVAFVFPPGSEARLVMHGAPLVADAERVAGGVEHVAPPPPWTRDGVTIANPVRVGGNIKPPTKVKDVRPIFPADARAAGVQGVVILDAVIGPEGRVDQLRVLRAIPLLDQAAMDAVKEWEFTPTLLNGVPVPVTMTVTVNFTLQ